MVKRHTNHDVSFYCFTDDASGLDADVIPVEFPDIPVIHPKYWFGSEAYKYGLARCWDRPKTFIFNMHNQLNISGRFIFFDLDVIIQNNINPLLTYNFDQPVKLKSWWQDPRPVQTRRFKISHGAYTNGSCMVWSDDQCEVIWKDVLTHQEKIWFTFTDGTDNYHTWRWKELWDFFPAYYAYSYNRGRSWKDDDLSVGKYRENCILCVFNVDLLPFDDGTRGQTKQQTLVDPNLLKHWQ